MANPDGVYIAYQVTDRTLTTGPSPTDEISVNAIIFTALAPTQQHALDADPTMRVAFWRYGEPLSTAIERAELEARERREKSAAGAPAKPKRSETAAS
ncbi:MAG: hypothetical protein AB7T06_40815 [Kofleriaceae bacterium]